MKQVTIDMLEIYKPISNLDWLNYHLVKKNVTFHHIKKKEHGGKLEVSNGALLMPMAHEYLHVIEYKDIEAYILINKIFQMINEQRHEATQGQRQMIEYILREFEQLYKDKYTSKGKPIIKKEYLKRGFEV